MRALNVKYEMRFFFVLDKPHIRKFKNCILVVILYIYSLEGQAWNVIYSHLCGDKNQKSRMETIVG